MKFRREANERLEREQPPESNAMERPEVPAAHYREPQKGTYLSPGRIGADSLSASCPMPLVSLPAGKRGPLKGVTCHSR